MGGAGGGVMARPGGRGDGLWGMLPSPSSVWPPASHLPPPGGRLIAAPTDTTVQSCKCQCPKPSPSRGKVAPPEAVTDEGEKNPRAAQPTNSKAKETPPKGSVPRKASIFHWSRLVLFLSCFDPQDKISNFGIGPTFGSQTQNHSSTLRHIHSEPSFVIVTIILPDYIKHFKAV